MQVQKEEVRILVRGSAHDGRPATALLLSNSNLSTLGNNQQTRVCLFKEARSFEHMEKMLGSDSGANLRSQRCRNRAETPMILKREHEEQWRDGDLGNP